VLYFTVTLGGKKKGVLRLCEILHKKNSRNGWSSEQWGNLGTVSCKKSGKVKKMDNIYKVSGPSKKEQNDDITFVPGGRRWSG